MLIQAASFAAAIVLSEFISHVDDLHWWPESKPTAILHEHPSSAERG